MSDIINEVATAANNLEKEIQKTTRKRMIRPAKVDTPTTESTTKEAPAVTPKKRASSKVAAKKARLVKPRASTMIRTIEKEIKELEGVNVIFRVSQQLRVKGPGYSFVRRLDKGSDLGALINRIKRTLGSEAEKIEFVIISGNGTLVKLGADKQPLDNIIESYNVVKATKAVAKKRKQ